MNLKKSSTICCVGSLRALLDRYSDKTPIAFITADATETTTRGVVKAFSGSINQWAVMGQVRGELVILVDRTFGTELEP